MKKVLGTGKSAGYPTLFHGFLIKVNAGKMKVNAAAISRRR